MSQRQWDFSCQEGIFLLMHTESPISTVVRYSWDIFETNTWLAVIGELFVQALVCSGKPPASSGNIEPTPHVQIKSSCDIMAWCDVIYFSCHSHATTSFLMDELSDQISVSRSMWNASFHIVLVGFHISTYGLTRGKFCSRKRGWMPPSLPEERP